MLAWPINGDSRAQRTAKSLSQLYETEIFSVADDLLPVPPLIQELPVHYVKERPRTLVDRLLLPWHSNAQALLEHILGCGKSFDLVYCHDLDTLAVGCALKRRWGCKLLYDVHDLSIETVNQGFPPGARGLRRAVNFVRIAAMRLAFSLVERYHIRSSDLTITVNESIRAYIERRYPIACQVVQNLPVLKTMPEGKLLRQALGIAPDCQVVLYHGNLGRGRYMLELVESARDFREGIVLVVVGDGELLPQLKAAAGSNVYFLGRVDYDQLFSYTADADLGVVLLEHINYSKKHASANKMFEYMACAVPVLASDSPELVRVVGNDEAAGYILKHVTPSTIAQRVNELCAAPARLQEAGAVARALYEEKYNWAEAEKHFLSLVKELHDGHHH